MKIISIGTDRSIFKQDSAIRARVIEYGTLFDELHIVVFSRRALVNKKEQVSENVWIYPTNSLFKLLYIRDALLISSRIVRERKLSMEDTVVTCQDPFETGLVGMKLKKKFNIPLHIQIHTDLLSPFFSSSSVLNRIRIRLAKKVFKQADAVRAVSKRIADSLFDSKIILKSPTILPIFVDVEKIQNTSVTIDLKKKYPQFNFVILMASRLTKEKNIFLALNVMTKLVKQYPRVGLIVVGEGLEEESLKSFVEDHNLTRNVVFEAWRGDLISYYKTANLFLVTSDYEGYSMTVVEALSAHCPTISTDVGIASEVLKDGDSFVCPVGDSKCLFEKVKKFIENSGLRETFTHEAFLRLPLVTCPSKKEYLEKYKASIESAQMSRKI